MTETIEQRGQALSEEIRDEASKLIGFSGPTYQVLTRWADSVETLCRAIERHEAFRREVSEAVEYLKALYPTMPTSYDRFIIAKPDPLVEVLRDMGYSKNAEVAEEFRTILARYKGKIVWGEG